MVLEAEGIGHFEEPCPYWELEQTKQVTDALAIDVTGGEQDWVDMARRYFDGGVIAPADLDSVEL